MERGLEPDRELTRRELEVLRVVCDGLSDKEVGRRLAIRPATVRAHVANLRRKLGTGSRAELGVKAARLGLLPEKGP